LQKEIPGMEITIEYKVIWDSDAVIIFICFVVSR
jgi:hypothetical protein